MSRLFDIYCRYPMRYYCADCGVINRTRLTARFHRWWKHG